MKYHHCREELTKEFARLRTLKPSFEIMPALPSRAMTLVPPTVTHQYDVSPVATALRAVMLVDCTSAELPRFVGVHTDASSTVVDVRRAAAKSLKLSFNEAESV